MRLLEIKKELSENDSYIKDFAFFLDKNNGLNLVSIRIVPNVMIGLKSYNEKGKETGYANLIFHQNRRIYLDTIYCYDEFRSLNIASNISQIIDYVLQDYPGFIIRGEYKPAQLSTDREKKKIRSQEELNKRADNFYAAAGYSKIYYEEYIKNPIKYPDINELDDFQLGEGTATCIVVKKFVEEKQESFKKIKGFLINKGMIDRIKDKLIRGIEDER